MNRVTSPLFQETRCRYNSASSEPSSRRTLIESSIPKQHQNSISLKTGDLAELLGISLLESGEFQPLAPARTDFENRRCLPSRSRRGKLTRLSAAKLGFLPFLAGGETRRGNSQRGGGGRGGGCLLLFRGLIYRGGGCGRGCERRVKKGGAVVTAAYGARERFRGGDAIRRPVLAASPSRRAAPA